MKTTDDTVNISTVHVFVKVNSLKLNYVDSFL